MVPFHLMQKKKKKEKIRKANHFPFLFQWKFRGSKTFLEGKVAASFMPPREFVMPGRPGPCWVLTEAPWLVGRPCTPDSGWSLAQVLRGAGTFSTP